VFGFVALTREVYRDMCEAKRGVLVTIDGGFSQWPARM